MRSFASNFFYFLSKYIMLICITCIQLFYAKAYLSGYERDYIGLYHTIQSYYFSYVFFATAISILSLFFLGVSQTFRVRKRPSSALILYPLAYIPFAYIPFYLYKFFTRNIPRERDPLRVFTFKLTSGLLGLVSKNNKE